jgi:hypothetical protein
VNTKAYILFEALDGKCESIVQALQGMPGVVVVDRVEGPPDIVAIVEASDRQKLAKRVISAIASVENMTEGCNVLPTRDDGVLIRGKTHSKDVRRVPKNLHHIYEGLNGKTLLKQLQ